MYIYYVHLGTNLLKAYMHGYFVDIRLYRKAKSVAEPFTYEEYRRKKIREKIESQRVNRVQIQVKNNHKLMSILNTEIILIIAEIACCKQRTCFEIDK